MRSKYFLFIAFVSMFMLSANTAWAQYVKVTAADGSVSWAKIEGIIDGTNIEIYKGYWSPAIDYSVKGDINLSEVWSEEGGKGTHYQVTSIGDYAFVICLGLTSVTIPNSVTRIGIQAFQNCNLTSVTIPNSVISIGDQAFTSSSLTSVTIPKSVTSIGYMIFGDCTGLTSIVVASGNPVYDSRNNCNAIIESRTNTLIAACKKTTIPNSVTSIGKYAFGYCRDITSVTIPQSVTSIGESAFTTCRELTSLTIPKSVTSIGYLAFSGCASLNSIVVASDNPVYDSRNACNAIIETKTNTLLAGCMNTKIPKNITSIADYAFYASAGLTSVTIPKSVTSIGRYAFSYCNKLTSITSYITDVFETGYDAFIGSDHLTLYVPKGLVSTYQSTADWKRISKIEEISNSYDVNSDGSIDISDVVVLVNAILTSSTGDSYDVNRDGSVDISDVVALVNIILGQ